MNPSEQDKQRNISKLKEWFIRLIKLHNSPPEVALGVAIGVFIAILPLYGLHTVLALLAAVLIKRANKIAIFLGTNISTVFTFPFITWTGYEIGKFIIRDHYPALSWQTFKVFSYKTLLNFYYPLFIGSVVLGLVLAVIFYFFTFWLVAKHRKKHLSSTTI